MMSYPARENPGKSGVANRRIAGYTTTIQTPRLLYDKPLRIQ
jgi:hypothetical protein